MSAAREEVEHLTTLVHHPGWELLSAWLQERIDAGTREILGGDLSHEKYLAACAEVSMAQWVIDRPHDRIAFLTAQLEEENQ